MHYLLVSAPILSTCVYEGLVNKSSTTEGSSDTASEETKCRVSLLLVNYSILQKMNPEIWLLHEHEVKIWLDI